MESKFYRWLGAHINEDTFIGDLARDVADDSLFPEEEENIVKIERHLRSRNACIEAIEALREAWRTFKAETKSAK